MTGVGTSSMNENGVKGVGILWVLFLWIIGLLFVLVFDLGFADGAVDLPVGSLGNYGCSNSKQIVVFNFIFSF